MNSAEENIHIIAATNGFTSYFLLWLTVMWGLVLRNGWALTRVRHSTLQAIHTTVALLGLTLGTVHAVAQLAVPAGRVRLIDVWVPFTNLYDPIGIGVGVIGLEIMIAAALSIAIQRVLGYSRWRALHSLTYVAFTLVAAHILISGTDMEEPLRWGLVLAAWVAVVAVWLITTPWMVRLRRRRGDEAAGRQRALHDITVNVNSQRCVQFGFCEHEAPDVFQLRSDGRLAYRATVTTEEASAVIRAAEVCPARAILLNRVPTSVMTARPEEPLDHPPEPPEPPRGGFPGEGPYPEAGGPYYGPGGGPPPGSPVGGPPPGSPVGAAPGSPVGMPLGGATLSRFPRRGERRGGAR